MPQSDIYLLVFKILEYTHNFKNVIKVTSLKSASFGTFTKYLLNVFYQICLQSYLSNLTDPVFRKAWWSATLTWIQCLGCATHLWLRVRGLELDLPPCRCLSGSQTRSPGSARLRPVDLILCVAAENLLSCPFAACCCHRQCDHKPHLPETNTHFRHFHDGAELVSDS